MPNQQEGNAPLGLMNYLSEFELLKCRDENVNIALKNVLNTLNVLKMALAFSFTQAVNEESEVKTIINDERFKDMVDPSFGSVSLRLNTYFKLNDSVLALREKESTELFNCITELTHWLDSSFDNLEAKQVREIDTESTEDKPKQPIDEFAELLPPMEETAEDEEEISSKHFYYECSNPECKNIMVNAEVGGCTDCGTEKLNVKYI